MVVVGLLPLLPACSSRASLHDSLKLTPSQIEKAKTRARSVIRTKGDPYAVYGGLMRDVNVRVSADVILRQS